MEYPVIRVALVADKCSPVAKVMECSWGKLQKQLCKISIGEKDGVAWMPVEIPVGPRKKEFVQSVSALVLDVERTKGGILGPPSVDEIETKIQKLGYSAIIHTTHTHTSEAPRYRLIFQIGRPLQNDELKPLGEHVARQLGIPHCYDKGALEPARLYYLPRCPEDREQEFRSACVHGSPINVDSALIEAARSSPPKSTATIFNFPAGPTVDVCQLREMLSFVSADSDYTTWRNIVWAVLASGSPSAVEIACDWSQSVPDRFDREAFDIVAQSFDQSRGITTGTLIYHAKLGGWAERKIDEPSVDSRRFPVLSLHDLESLPPLKWLVKGLLPACGLAAVYGPSGSGKSFLALDLIAKISQGHKFYGMKVTRSPVIYVALEGAGGVSNRIRAWQQTNSNLGDNFQVMMAPFSLMSLDSATFAAELGAAGFKNGVIVIDTLNQSAPQADENTSKDMGTIIAHAKHLALATSSLVILVHHSGKDSSRGLRGHSSLLAALDATIEVEKKAEGRSWKVPKVKDGVDGLTYNFDLKSVVLGKDDDGDDISSCVAVPAPFRTQQLSAPKGDNQRKVLDALRASGSSPRTEADICELAKAALQSVDLKHRASRAKEAVASLRISGHLIEEDGFLKIVN